jgi:hypothetical protein
MLNRIVVIPRPKSRLKTGPAMQPVNAISPKPFLLIAIDAKVSPTELPHDNTVKPSNAALTPLIHS